MKDIVLFNSSYRSENPAIINLRLLSIYIERRLLDLS